MEMKLGQGHIIEVPMNAAELEAIVGGYHGDAFSVLGPHPVDVEPGKRSWEVRAFLPQARSAFFVAGGVSTEMEKFHREGFFVVALKREPGPYQFRIEDYHGGERLLEDPYRFGTIATDFDLHLHAEGNLRDAWKVFGSHLTTRHGVAGARFAVWAPNALLVTVVGDFNDWDPRRHPMRLRTAGVWEIFLPGVKDGDSYKYFLKSRELGYQVFKADPYARRTEVPPKSASVVCDLSGYVWNDSGWMERRALTKILREPFSIYEVHLESWMRGPAGAYLTYVQMAVKLVEYVKRMGYTHVELMPIQEYPFSGSWGYQVTGYFAPTARFGRPEDFMHLVDAFHQAGIGVLIDWVPAHFPKDAHGLAWFDGTAVYEHSNPMQGEHREWGTLIFNFGRNEVREFLIASALFWLKQYHIDGLRVDAVAAMLYLDYERKAGEWIPNRFGGRENLEAIEFLRRFNELVHEVPGAVSIAEESTSFAGVSRPVYLNGLGFTMKWNMGWMHDMLDYFAVDPVNRKYYHNKITFSLMYAFSENFVLPISHDEIVYGKRSLLSKMPGDQWQKFANVRAFLSYMYTHPGKKLLFMGNDIGDYNEWDHNSSVPWWLLQYPMHAGLQLFVRELNRVYREEPALHEVDFEYSGFEWIDFSDVEKSIISFMRRAERPGNDLVVACNFTPVPRTNYRIGVPAEGFYREILNSDAAMFGGSNMGNGGGVNADLVQKHRHPCSISITLPPLGVVVFKRRG
jgi:1,4-alpha-glucan branching enzyme